MSSFVNCRPSAAFPFAFFFPPLQRSSVGELRALRAERSRRTAALFNRRPSRPQPRPRRAPLAAFSECRPSAVRLPPCRRCRQSAVGRAARCASCPSAACLPPSARCCRSAVGRPSLSAAAVSAFRPLGRRAIRVCAASGIASRFASRPIKLNHHK